MKLFCSLDFDWRLANKTASMRWLEIVYFLCSEMDGISYRVMMQPAMRDFSGDGL
jgi:hypothetical protein